MRTWLMPAARRRQAIGWAALLAAFLVPGPAGGHHPSPAALAPPALAPARPPGRASPEASPRREATPRREAGFAAHSAEAAASAAKAGKAGCTTPAEVTLRVLAQVPDAEAVQHQGAMAERLGALFNMTPPPTDYPVDRAIGYSSDRLARVLVVLFFHGCRVGAVYLPRDAYLALVRDATGVAL